MSHNVMRLTSRELNVEEQQRLNRIKVMAEDLHDRIVEAGSNRELTIARGKLEECVMWASKGISAPIV